MNPQQVFLVCQAAAWIVVLSYLLHALLRSRDEKYKYKIYALRDRLIYLVASKKLSEESLVFKTFYSAVTRSIGQIDRLTIYTLIEASLAAKTAIEKQKQTRLEQAIEHSSPEVREFVNEYASSMMEIMLKNSPLLLFMIWAAGRCGDLIKWLRGHVSIPPGSSYKLYDSYRYFERIHSLAS